MAEPQWYTKQGPDGKWYKTQASSPQEATQKLLRSIGATPPASSVRPDTAVDKMFPVGGTVSAPHPRTGLAGAEDTLSSLMTRLSARMQKGVGQGVGDAMPATSIARGALKIARGGTEVPQGEIWKGTKDIAGGAMDAAQTPLMFLAPEASEAAGKMLPSTERAGQLFQELEKVAGSVPVDVQKPGQVATKIWDLAQAGGSRPKIINDFLRRVTNPKGAPMDYSEMRKFYQNATRLSADETNRLTPAVKRLIGDFTQKLGDSLWEAAQSVGEGGKFNNAMKGYRQGARFNEMKKAAAKAALSAGAGAAGVSAYRHLVPK